MRRSGRPLHKKNGCAAAGHAARGGAAENTQKFVKADKIPEKHCKTGRSLLDSIKFGKEAWEMRHSTAKNLFRLAGAFSAGALFPVP